MSRPIEPKIKEDLFEKCVQEILKQGSLQFSINDLGKKIGSSGRMLVYHFCSKEELVELIVQHIENELRKEFLILAKTKCGRKHFMINFWDRLTTNKRIKALLIVMHDAIYSSQLNSSLEKEADLWLELFQEQLGDYDSANLIWMVMNGAIANFLMTGDSKRGHKALVLALKNLK